MLCLIAINTVQKKNKCKLKGANKEWRIKKK